MKQGAEYFDTLLSGCECCRENISKQGLTCVSKRPNVAGMTTKNYFAAAKKIAKANIADVSAAHAAAIAKLREMVPGKSEAFYGEMGWAAVMAARS